MISTVTYELRPGSGCDDWFLYRTESGLPWQLVATFSDEDHARFAQQAFQHSREQWIPAEEES